MDRRELREMRAAVEGLFPDFCNLLTVTETSNGAGGSSASWGTAIKNVPCRLDQMVGSERVTEGSLRPFVSLELAIPFDVEISNGQRVEHGGYTYHVIDANLSQSWQIEKQILLEKLS